MEIQMLSHKNLFWAVNSAVLRVAVKKVSVNWRLQGERRLSELAPPPKGRRLADVSVDPPHLTGSASLVTSWASFYPRQYQSWPASSDSFGFALSHIAQASVFHMEARVCPTCSLVLSYITGCMNKWLTVKREASLFLTASDVVEGRPCGTSMPKQPWREERYVKVFSEWSTAVDWPPHLHHVRTFDWMYLLAFNIWSNPACRESD